MCTRKLGDGKRDRAAGNEWRETVDAFQPKHDCTGLLESSGARTQVCIVWPLQYENKALIANANKSRIRMLANEAAVAI